MGNELGVRNHESTGRATSRCRAFNLATPLLESTIGLIVSSDESLLELMVSRPLGEGEYGVLVFPAESKVSDLPTCGDRSIFDVEERLRNPRWPRVAVVVQDVIPSDTKKYCHREHRIRATGGHWKDGRVIHTPSAIATHGRAACRQSWLCNERSRELKLHIHFGCQVPEVVNGHLAVRTAENALHLDPDAIAVVGHQPRRVSEVANDLSTLTILSSIERKRLRQASWNGIGDGPFSACPPVSAATTTADEREALAVRSLTREITIVAVASALTRVVDRGWKPALWMIVDPVVGVNT
jgi:hypothetical protein